MAIFLRTIALAVVLLLPAVAGARTAPVYVHFFDWFDEKAWDEKTFVELFDWRAVGTSLAERGTVRFYERQFAYLKSMGATGLAWEFNATRGGDLTYPPDVVIAAARRAGLKIVPIYDLEITLQVYAGSKDLTPTLATPSAITATPETAAVFCRDLNAFYRHVPADLRGEDADGAAPVFVFGFGFDDSRLDPAAWTTFSKALDDCMAPVAGPKFKFYWSATNHPMEEHLFQHDRQHFVPWQFVSDNPQSQWAPDSVTLNFGFDNLGVQRRDKDTRLQLRVVRVDPRYVEEPAWVAASADPALVFLYGWNEPFEGSILFPTLQSGDRKARVAHFMLDKIRAGLPPLPKTIIIADDLDALYTTRKGDWHLILLRDMMLYRMRLFAPQADAVMPKEVTPELLSRYDAVVDLTSTKTAALVSAVSGAAATGKRVMIFDPMMHDGPDSYGPQFFDTMRRADINAEISIDGGGSVFARDDVYAGRLCAACGAVMTATREGERMPLVVLKSGMVLVNSYANSDEVMTRAFAAFYGRPMGCSILYGEALASQRLEIAPDGAVTENHLARGTIDFVIPIPREFGWDVLPPDVPPAEFGFLFGLSAFRVKWTPILGPGAKLEIGCSVR